MDTRATCREQKVFDVTVYMMKHNLTTKETAKHFHMLEKTVKKYVNDLLREVSFSLWVDAQEYLLHK